MNHTDSKPHRNKVKSKNHVSLTDLKIQYGDLSVSYNGHIIYRDVIKSKTGTKSTSRRRLSENAVDNLKWVVKSEKGYKDSFSLSTFSVAPCSTKIPLPTFLKGD
jgi:hypothetical protein